MIIKIVCAGQNDFSSLYKKDDNEFIIAVDGGIKAVKEKNLIADLLIGDFDSCNLSEDEYRNNYLKKMTFNARKDYSDLELALQECEKNSHCDTDEILIYNATGIRLDHFYANILLLEKYSNLKAKIIDKNNCIFIIDKDETFFKNEYKYISFFALESDTIISLNGFSYDLSDYNLNINDPLCLSNEILKNSIATIKVNNKKVLVIRSN